MKFQGNAFFFDRKLFAFPDGHNLWFGTIHSLGHGVLHGLHSFSFRPPLYVPFDQLYVPFDQLYHLSTFLLTTSLCSFWPPLYVPFDHLSTLTTINYLMKFTVVTTSSNLIVLLNMYMDQLCALCCSLISLMLTSQKSNLTAPAPAVGGTRQKAVLIFNGLHTDEGIDICTARGYHPQTKSNKIVPLDISDRANTIVSSLSEWSHLPGAVDQDNKISFALEG